MKLKTLKDFTENKLKKGTGCYAGKGLRADYAEISSLRQEAIKWIKELKKDAGAFYFPLMDIAVGDKGKECMIVWIKHFFNITDQELEEWQKT